ncbi:MAG: type I DNA topoisomerase [Candidatus Nomurabacteria bacterium]|nr:type I DNA topoisomerase [Candidatus Nomurabacteria bacterium]
MNLLIVESPSKAKTIEKYLKDVSGNFVVRSSVGHVRDLPKSNKEAVDIEAGFVPKYQISAGKKKVVDELTTLAKKADTVYLAPDPDREGEAIAWHLEQILHNNKSVTAPIKRVTFNEITETAVKEALQHPREVDQDMRRAQEARRVLDRIVGYDLSGLIWKKVRYGLSAGRVQSPALRIIMEREREIRAFDPEDYFLIHGMFKKTAMEFGLDCDIEFKDMKIADQVIADGKSGKWTVTKIKETDAKRNPYAPFTTSTLQQTASTKLGMSPGRTMQVAQRLYEAGHITYMRTDSPTLSKEATAKIAKLVEKEFGKDYLEVKTFKSKSKNAQEAHEGIRPTKISMNKTLGATDEQKSLYELIWARTIASQMAPAGLIRTKVSANIGADEFPNFSVTGSRVVFPGWLAADTRSRTEDTEVPKLAVGDTIDLIKLEREDKQTQPPNRYTEAGLIKELEKRGIGRPSTYASIMRTLQDRGYVEKQGRTLLPTDTGDVVSSFLEENFMDYISDIFTADMEDKLDDIAGGNAEYVKVLSDFYKPFQKDLASKEDIPKLTTLGAADAKFKCPKCKKSMDIKLGRGGKFLSCSNYPDCDGALTLDGKEVGNAEPMGVHTETGKNLYVLEGRFGPYVQLGESPKIPRKTTFEKGHKKTDEEKALVKAENLAIKEAKALPKPRRASIPADIKPGEVTIALATKLLILPRELGLHPDDNVPVISNVGRFGPYVGHNRDFRSIKKTDDFDPYTITFDQAIALLNQPKNLPKGVEVVRVVGKHPKTGKVLQIVKSKSGMFVFKGMKRLYFPDNTDAEKVTVEDIVKLMAG